MTKIEKLNYKKEGKPTVSVIIPAFNAEKYISETLKSLFNQTFTDFEAIVINDGSTDSTLSILKKYEDRVYLINKKNGGPASARNTGICQSRGEYICFLDSDDLWAPNKLQAQVRTMRNSDCLMSYTDVEVFKTEDDYKKAKKMGVLTCDLEGEVVKDLFWNNFIVNSSVMFRKSCINVVGLLDESPLLIGVEDYDYWIRISLKGKIKHIPQVLVSYRLHNTNLLGNSYDKSLVLCSRLYSKLFKCFPEISNELKSDLSNSLSDLYIRYAYKNLVDLNRPLAIKKVVESLRFSWEKGLLALPLILLNNTSPNNWKSIIPKFELWNRIVNNSWAKGADD